MKHFVFKSHDGYASGKTALKFSTRLDIIVVSHLISLTVLHLQFFRVVGRRRAKRKLEHQRRRARNIASCRYTLPFRLDVCIDCRFSSKMSDKEISKLVKQLGRVWGLQKK